MNNENKPEGFSYTYSAKQMDEVKSIRSKYEVREETEDKMEKLRRLDASVTKKERRSLLFSVYWARLLWARE